MVGYKFVMVGYRVRLCFKKLQFQIVNGDICMWYQLNMYLFYVLLIKLLEGFMVFFF